MQSKTLTRTIRTALASTAAAAVMSTAAMAGNGSQNEPGWQGEMRDAWVDGKIEASYTLNSYLNPFAIDTDVEHGVVFLSGTVESEIDRDLAEEIARSIDGVSEVRNELRVATEAENSNPEDNGEDMASEFSKRVADATTTARVKYALLANDSTEGLSINVDTIDGTVILNGEVDSAQQSDLAERIAANAEGVAEVKNRLQISEQS